MAPLKYPSADCSRDRQRDRQGKVGWWRHRKKGKEKKKKKKKKGEREIMERNGNISKTLLFAMQPMGHHHVEPTAVPAYSANHGAA